MNIYKIASFDVDSQCGFTPLCPDELPVAEGDEIVSELLKNHDLAGHHLASKDAHSRNANWVATEENPQLSKIEGDNLDLRWNSHCNVGEKGFELLPGLPPMTYYDFFVYKGLEKDMHPYGACFHDFKKKISTGVLEWLQSRDVELVIVGGLALDFCVKETIKELLNYGYDVILNEAATRHIIEKEKVIDELYKYSKRAYCGHFESFPNTEEIKLYLETL